MADAAGTVSRERWIAVTVGFIGVLAMAHPSGAGDWFGMLNALICAGCNAVGTLTVRDLCRTETTASIVFYTALFMTLMAVPFLPFAWAAPTLPDFALLCSLGLLGAVSQYLTTTALFCAPAAAVSPFNYTALVWGLLFGFIVWSELPTAPIIAGAAIVTLSGLYLLRQERSGRRRAVLAAVGPRRDPRVLSD